MAASLPPSRRHLRNQPDGRALEIVSLELVTAAQAAFLHFNRLDVFIVVAVVRDELRAAVRAENFERALWAGGLFLVRAETKTHLGATGLFRAFGRASSPL